MESAAIFEHFPLAWFLLLQIYNLQNIEATVCVGSLILVARMCDNCDAHCYCCLFVMNMSSILIVPKVVIVARYSCSIQNSSSDGINWCKACHTANLHTL